MKILQICSNYCIKHYTQNFGGQMDINKRFEHDKLKKFQIFNAAQLKYIAFISMLIDHVNNSIVTHFLNGKGALLYISNFLSILGRIAFPIFIFFIVEGFFKTHNRAKYLRNLVIFGIFRKFHSIFSHQKCCSIRTGTI